MTRRCSSTPSTASRLDGEDLRTLPLSMRKTDLAQLLRSRPDGIFAAPFEQGEIGPDLFKAACDMGLEGIVSKLADRPARPVFWSRSYGIMSCGGAPLSVLKQYIERQAAAGVEALSGRPGATRRGRSTARQAW